MPYNNNSFLDIQPRKILYMYQTCSQQNYQYQGGTIHISTCSIVSKDTIVYQDQQTTATYIRLFNKNYVPYESIYIKFKIDKTFHYDLRDILEREKVKDTTTIEQSEECSQEG